MFVSSFNRMYSPAEWRILELAHRRACTMLDRDPQFHPLAERVACAIIFFFERGERDFGRLASMTVRREQSLLKTNSGSASIIQLSSVRLGCDPPRYLH